MSEKNIPAFGIKRVKEFSFLIDESLFELNKQVRIQFQHHTLFRKEENIVDLTLRVYYSYEIDVPPKTVLVDFHVQNVFEVRDLKQYEENNSGGFYLPENLIASMVGVAISHTRSLMAHNVAGTLYQNNIIPIVNPLEVARAFYPNMFIKTNEGLKAFTEATDELNKAINSKQKRVAVKKKKKQ